MTQRPRPTTEARRDRAERGAATVLVVPAALALCAVLLGGVARLGVVATSRARADAVADLVALAAVTGERTGADAVAGANDARVIEVTAAGERRTVVVELDGVRASASAAPAGSPGD